MSNYTINLAPIETFGRSLQLAGVGILLGELIERGDVTVDLERGEIRVNPGDYADAAEVMLKLLDEEIYNNIEIKLYPGGTSDRKILSYGTKKKPGANLHICDKDEPLTWVSAAKCYLRLVVYRGGPLGKPKGVPLPLLMRINVYSKIRGNWHISRQRFEFTKFDIRANVDTIGLALIGGIAAIIASYKSKSRRQGKQVLQEVYLVPGESFSSITNAGLVYTSFHSISSITGSAYNALVNEIRNREELSVSWDIALQLAAYLHLSDLLEYLVEAGDPYSNFYLISIDASGNRPQAYSAQVVSAFSIFSKLGANVASRLVWAIKSTSNISDTYIRRGVFKALSRCIHNLFNYYWSGNKDYIYECARLVEASASSLSLKRREGTKEAINSLEALARSLHLIDTAIILT